MAVSKLWSWLGGRDTRARRSRSNTTAFRPALASLEDRTVLNGYIAVGAGAGAQPLVAIRVDKINASLGQPPNPAGTEPAANSDGKTDFTTQTLLVYDQAFRGGVHVATGNFDGDYTTPNFLVVAPGPGGGPHIKVYTMVQDAFGNITVGALFTQFLAYTPTFKGGVNVTAGDLDGDGRSELITGAGPGGGPHVKVYKLDISDQKAVLVNEFMAYESTFRGGVSVASNQGYQVPYQIRQVLSAQLPGTFPGSNFLQAPYPAGQTVPGSAEGIPLVGYIPGLTGTSTVPSGNIFQPYFTVGGGTIQFVGGNLLNGYGSIAYEPNVIDPLGTGQIPPQQPLVIANWGATDVNLPPGFIPTVDYGPFVQVQPAVGSNPPVITRLQNPLGQSSSRSQLVTGPGPGGGPVVRIWDYRAGLSTVADRTEFLAFGVNSVDRVAGIDNYRGGISVSIGDVIDLPNVDSDPRNPPNIYPNTDTYGGQDIRAVTFPYSTNTYRQYGSEIVVSTLDGGLMGTYADYNPNVVRRTAISQLQMAPVRLRTIVGPDPGNPIGGFQSIFDLANFNAIDPQFRGQIFTTASALRFSIGANPSEFFPNVNGNTQTFTGERNAFTFATGATTSGVNRGPRVVSWDDLGPNVVFTTDFFNNPDSIVNQTGNVQNVGGNTPYLDPVDSFSAFLSGAFPNGAGGVAFGFGVLPAPSLAITELTPIAVPSVSNPRLI